MNTDPLPESILRALDGTSVPLKGVGIRGTLRDLAAEIAVEQRYANETRTHIEAVYSFPLPIGAVLLSLEVEIGDRRLSGQVVEKQAAETKYEAAVSGGDTAVMLELTGPGLYTMNVGNLMAGESAVIRYRYALLLSWQGDRVRLLLPTTIAPRYGSAERAGLQSHQIPESSLRVDYPLDFDLEIQGELAGSAISSPSHAVAMTRTEQGLRITLAGNATLDRDFILMLRGEQASAARLLPHGDFQGRQIALASLRIPPSADQEKVPLHLKIVIDCSGSMAGMSIAQARKAALAILDQLRPDDCFNVTLFGNDYRHFWQDMVSANARHISHAWQRLEQLDADMGGTETNRALCGVYQIGKTPGRMQRFKNSVADKVRAVVGAGHPAVNLQPQILLITDGEVWDYAQIVKDAAASRHRVFTVGVGMAVAEGLVSELAKATGGACELVSPQEGMTESILGQFHRMRQARIRQANIAFDVAPAWMTPMPATLFAGDTVHVFAGFDGKRPQHIALTASDDADQALTTEARVETTDWIELPRLAAAQRLAESQTEQEQTRLALDYQLITEHTNYIVVAEREEKAEDLPVLAKVPQMMAAGWGGHGVVGEANMSYVDSLQTIDGVSDCMCSISSRPTSRASAFEVGLRDIDIPAFLRRSSDDYSSAPARTPAAYVARESEFHSDSSAASEPRTTESPGEFIDNLQSSLGTLLNFGELPDSIDELARLGLPEGISHALHGFVDDLTTERHVVGAFLMALMQSPALAERFPRGFKRLILGYWQRCGGQENLLAEMKSCIAGITANDWDGLIRTAAPASREIAA